MTLGSSSYLAIVHSFIHKIGITASFLKYYLLYPFTFGGGVEGGVRKYHYVFLQGLTK